MQPAGPQFGRGGTLNQTSLSASPVIQGIESEAEWLTHREDVTRGLAPIGDAEEALAEEIAVLLWRQRQVFRLREYLRTLVAGDQPDQPASIHATRLARLAEYTDDLDRRMARAYRRLDAFREERSRHAQALAPASATPGSLRDTARRLLRKRSSAVMPQDR